MNETTTDEGVIYRVCRRCGHKWIQRIARYPRVCPNTHCHSTYWDTERGSPVAPLRPEEVQR